MAQCPYCSGRDPGVWVWPNVHTVLPYTPADDGKLMKVVVTSGGTPVIVEEITVS